MPPAARRARGPFPFTHSPTWAGRAEKDRFHPSLVKTGRQVGMSCWRSVWRRARAVFASSQSWQKHGDDLAEGIDRQPQPQDRRRATQPGAQFVQVEMREGEVLQGAV